MKGNLEMCNGFGLNRKVEVLCFLCAKSKSEGLGKRRELLHNGVWFCNEWECGTMRVVLKN